MNRWTVEVIIAGALVLIGHVGYAEPPHGDENDRDRWTSPEAERSLEAFKDADPETYQQLKAQFERNKEINRIIDAFTQQTMNAAEAEQELYPLVKVQVDEERAVADNLMTGIKQQLSLYQQQLEEVELLKSNPQLVIKKRINQLLGKEEHCSGWPCGEQVAQP